MVDRKQKRSKKKKKITRNFSKTELKLQDSIKLSSDDERRSLVVGGMKSFNVHNLDPERKTIVTGQPHQFLLLRSSCDLRISGHPASLSAFSTDRQKQIYSANCSDQVKVGCLTQQLSDLSIKLAKENDKKQKKQRLKTAGKKTPPSKHKRHNKDKCTSKRASSSAQEPPNICLVPSAHSSASDLSNSKTNESLRWDIELDESEDERERIHLYKINRRKRYIAAAQAKGLEWAVNPRVRSPYQPSSSSDLVEHLRSTSVAYTGYIPMCSLRAAQGHGAIGSSAVEC